ncbi:MAG: lytic murein transglycosylase [Rhodospirillaceae bacterium]|nr:MAG: lytic murein transglycosylase [Rhodospirillaceae bacterium]
MAMRLSPQLTVTKGAFYALILVMGVALASCQNMSVRSSAAGTKPTSTAEVPAPLPPGYQDWLAQLRIDAHARGISQATIRTALDDVAPIPRILELDRRQPEFSQTFWRYFDGALTAKRIADGQALLAQHAALLKRIEGQYGVQPRFLVAFWGMESGYGHDTGGYPVVAALVTLAFDGRRADFFRAELFNALTIIDQGHIAPSRMIGSWAGAMGQTQFMPSTFLKYAVDEDGDGRMDIWADVPDALASAARYLKTLGWDGTKGWGREVKLPANFDVGLASIDPSASEIVKPLTEWSALGVRQADGHALPQQNLMAALVLPAGGEGPAFLVYDNYRAILKWNRSAFYAIAVGHLADRLIDTPPLQATHRIEEPLRREDIMAFQDGLQRLGYLKDAPDGVVGGSTRQAIRAFQRAHGLAPDGYANRAVATAILAQAGAAPRT